MREELSIPQHSIDPRDTIILMPSSGILFPLEHVIHPAAAAGEDGDGQSMTVCVINACGGDGSGEEAAQRGWIVGGVGWEH